MLEEPGVRLEVIPFVLLGQGIEPLQPPSTMNEDRFMAVGVESGMKAGVNEGQCAQDGGGSPSPLLDTQSDLHIAAQLAEHVLTQQAQLVLKVSPGSIFHRCLRNLRGKLLAWQLRIEQLISSRVYGDLTKVFKAIVVSSARPAGDPCMARIAE
ncbi:hypothetical protein VUR80DRAFT_2637 [Thermomyces stellatus]